MKKTASLMFLFAITTILFSSTTTFSSKKSSSCSSNIKRFAIGSVFASATVAATYFCKDYIKGIIPLVIFSDADRKKITQAFAEQIANEDRQKLVEAFTEKITNENKRFAQLKEEQEAAQVELEKLRKEIAKEKTVAEDALLKLGLEGIGHDLNTITKRLKDLETTAEGLKVHVETLGAQVQEELLKALAEKAKTLEESWTNQLATTKESSTDELAAMKEFFANQLAALKELADNTSKEFENALYNTTAKQVQTDEVIQQFKKKVEYLEEELYHLNQPQDTIDLLSDLAVRFANVSIAAAQKLGAFTQQTVIPFVAKETDRVINNPKNVGKLNVNPEYQGYDFSPLG